MFANVKTRFNQYSRNTMAWLTFLLVTILWGLVGGVGPFLIPSGPQKVNDNVIFKYYG